MRSGFGILDIGFASGNEGKMSAYTICGRENYCVGFRFEDVGSCQEIQLFEGNFDFGCREDLLVGSKSFGCRVRGLRFIKDSRRLRFQIW